MKNAWITLLFCFLFVIGFTHNNEPLATRLVSGKTIDKNTGEVLSGVKIQIEGSNSFCYSDLSGNYSITAPIKSKSNILANMIGYAPLYIHSEEAGMQTDLYLDPR